MLAAFLGRSASRFHFVPFLQWSSSEDPDVIVAFRGIHGAPTENYELFVL
jgi:hypothetical protein